ncbi:hypothetical protein JX265_005839 [Neoarthrinium moseri]|uniref:Uncharacterized protein n=1 Tax=Neoarthrinium moseri TaxID=1658444 RepID=A0A9P9WNU6_9PEZI|nr:uncharacterized protein JN550_011624 [Neoarthrinium moseri]KAI1860246.1 hypothetical protein JN550_011624 [Neoarthrinium moseri]KAI1871853.1 hypothetical protein JX265_005839 [Neoarthrinium moseri]
MSKRPKTFSKQAKGKQKAEPKLETADDFLAAGVDHEEAAGKHRAGDAAKSMRFFQRAGTAYDQGLALYPQNFDLAYNKARVLLEVATHPALVGQLQEPLLGALRTTLDAHQYALKLKPDNADTLFNTAQVLTSIAEELATEDIDNFGKEALKLLEEALELQAKCFSVQETTHAEFLEQERLANEQSGIAEGEEEPVVSEETAEQESSNEDDQWATVEEAVTYDTLVDTLVAQLNTLTTLCQLLNDASGSIPSHVLPMIENYSSKYIQKIQAISQHTPERLHEIALSKAKFTSSLLEAGFRSGQLDAMTYRRERDAAFSAPELFATEPFESFVANARSLTSFNSALADANADNSILRWNALTEATQFLSEASKIQRIDHDDLVTTHMLRGASNLSLYALALPPISHPAATKSAAQLLKNAEVFYRNASKMSGDEEEKEIAQLRSLVASSLQNKASLDAEFDIMAVVQASRKDPSWVMEQLSEMQDEGLLPSDA